MPAVSEDDWMSQFDAAEDLAVSIALISFLIQGRRLEPVHDGRAVQGSDARQSNEKPVAGPAPAG